MWRLSHFISKLKHRLQAIHANTNCLSSFPPSPPGRCGGVHEQTPYLSLCIKYVSCYLYQNGSLFSCRICFTTQPKFYNQLWDTSEHCFWQNFIKKAISLTRFTQRIISCLGGIPPYSTPLFSVVYHLITVIVLDSHLSKILMDPVHFPCFLQILLVLIGLEVPSWWLTAHSCLDLKESILWLYDTKVLNKKCQCLLCSSLLL